MYTCGYGVQKGIGDSVFTLPHCDSILTLPHFHEILLAMSNQGINEAIPPTVNNKHLPTLGCLEFCILSSAPVANLRVGASVYATFPPFRGNEQIKLHASPTSRDTRGQKWQNTTNRTAGEPAATASSACPALSLAADAVSFHTDQTVAANRLCWVVKESKEFKRTV